jgi:hypothetical protein
MGVTTVRSKQIRDNTIAREDLNVTDSGKAIIAKIVAGTGIVLSETGPDAGTGDVTVKVQENKYPYFTVPDDPLTVGTNKTGRLYIGFSGTIKEVHASVVTAPGGQAIICDINKNGSTIWTTQGNRVSIAAGTNTGTQTTFDVSSITAGDYLTIDIDQIGSTTAGGQLVVRIKIEPSV